MVFKELSPIWGGTTVFWGFKSRVTWFHPSHTVLWWTVNLLSIHPPFTAPLKLIQFALYFGTSWAQVLLSFLAIVFMSSTVRGISEQFLRQHCYSFVYMPWVLPFQFLFLNIPYIPHNQIYPGPLHPFASQEFKTQHTFSYKHGTKSFVSQAHLQV